MKQKVVLLNFCDGMFGGIESFLLNAFYCIDSNRFDVTFLTCGHSTYDMFKDDILLRGGHVEEIDILPYNFLMKLRLFRKLKFFFKNLHPDIVHINTGTLSLQLLASLAARMAKVKTIIQHSHNFRPNSIGMKEMVKKVIKLLLWHYGDYHLACSKGASLWMYPLNKVIKNQVIIIPNGVDTRRFLFDSTKRFTFRKELGLNDELVIGNIGRFQGQKNHHFMIKIMCEVVRINPTAKLLLVGEGILKNEIMSLVSHYSLQNNVFFLGERKDMDSFLSAIDIFILPSLYEGLPIASIEAQASGAHVILSDKITKEANITGNALYISIDQLDDEKKWAMQICRNNNHTNRIEANEKVFSAGFDVSVCYNKMIDIYSYASC